MKKINITTPENIEVEYNLADLGSRAAAAIIDIAIQGLLLILLLVGDMLIYFFAPEFWSSFDGWILGISLLISALVLYGYYIAMELTSNGRTIGKKVLKLRTIRTNGQSVTIMHSAIRNLFKVFIDMFGVGVVFIFLNKQHKRVGDMAASTIVVAEQTKTRPITLESLQGDNEKLSYYMTEEESDLLRDYLERKSKLENYEELRIQLKQHFTKKFEELGIFQEWFEFIKSL